MAEKVIKPSLPFGTVKKMMKAQYPEGLVSKDAVVEMQKTLQQIVINITKKAGHIALAGKRKTITAGDVTIACE